MVISFFSIGCLVCFSFLTGVFTFLYISSQLNQIEKEKCEFESEIKIGYKRNSIE